MVYPCLPWTFSFIIRCGCGLNRWIPPTFRSPGPSVSIRTVFFSSASECRLPGALLVGGAAWFGRPDSSGPPGVGRPSTAKRFDWDRVEVASNRSRLRLTWIGGDRFQLPWSVLGTGYEQIDASYESIAP